MPAHLRKTTNYYDPFAINILLLIVGCFMETVASIRSLFGLSPIIKMLNIDPVHFGVMMVLNLTIGVLTPPFGTVLYVLSGVAKVSVETVARNTAVFLIPLLITLVLVILFPQLTLFLPRVLYG